MLFNVETYRIHFWNIFVKRCMTCQTNIVCMYLLKLVELRKDRNDIPKSKRGGSFYKLHKGLTNVLYT